MKIWKRNAVIATVLLFICAGVYLNWSYNNRQKTPDLTDTLNAEQVMGRPRFNWRTRQSLYPWTQAQVRRMITLRRCA